MKYHESVPKFVFTACARRIAGTDKKELANIHALTVSGATSFEGKMLVPTVSSTER